MKELLEKYRKGRFRLIPEAQMALDDPYEYVIVSLTEGGYTHPEGNNWEKAFWDEENQEMLFRRLKVL